MHRIRGTAPIPSFLIESFWRRDCMSSCQHICMYTRHRFSAPNKSDYCEEGGGDGHASSLLCRIARPPRSRPARHNTSCCVPGCSLPRPRQARVALPARLNLVFRRVTKRTRSLLDLSRLLQLQKAKGAPGSRRFEQVDKAQYHDHAALAHWPHSLHSSFAPVPLNWQKRKGCFCISVSDPTGDNGSVPLSHGACRRKSKRHAFAALHHCRHCRS